MLLSEIAQVLIRKIQVIDRISIADYNQIPNKTSSGKPSQYMINKQYTPQIYVWQIPDVTTYSLSYWAVNQLEDVTSIIPRRLMFHIGGLIVYVQVYQVNWL